MPDRVLVAVPFAPGPRRREATRRARPGHPRPRPRLRGPRLALAVIAGGLLLAGCTSAPTGAGPGLTPALGALDRGDHVAAAEFAAAEASRATAAGDRAAARYVEGIALLRAGRSDRAIAALEAACDDPEVGPRAEAAIGLALVADGREGDGARRLMAVADRLPPVEAGRARRAARSAWRSIGDPRGEFIPADEAGATADDRNLDGSFGVQIGAFRARADAERVARDLATDLARTGAGAAVEAPTVSRRPRADGRDLWAVRLGPFPTRRAAERFAADHGEPGWRVVALGR